MSALKNLDAGRIPSMVQGMDRNDRVTSNLGLVDYTINLVMRSGFRFRAEVDELRQ